MGKDDNKTESLLRTDLSNKVKYIIAIIGFVATVGVPFYTIKQDVALIKQNHYAHIEALTKQIEANSQEIKKLNETQNKLMEIIIENKTKINLYHH